MLALDAMLEADAEHVGLVGKEPVSQPLFEVRLERSDFAGTKFSHRETQLISVNVIPMNVEVSLTGHPVLCPRDLQKLVHPERVGRPENHAVDI